MVTADALNRRGTELQLSGDMEGARLHYQAALEVDPLFAPAVANMTTVLGASNNLKAALTFARRAVGIAPMHGTSISNLGNILMRLGQFEEATTVLTRAAEIAPDNTAIWHNLALLYHRSDRPKLALDALGKLKALGHNTVSIQNDEAHILLAQGESLPRALELYESRWATLVHQPAWDFHIPEWKGERLAGKHILLHGEQGFGDTIMAARFARDLVAYGARVALCLPKGLTRLFEVQEWDGVTVVENTEEAIYEIAKSLDFHSPMYSAMWHLGIEWNNIRPQSYLKAPPITTAKILPAMLNVGICWASGTRGNDLDWRQRYAPLEYWLQLADDPRVQLWSLQVGKESTDIEALGAEGLIRDPTKRFGDFADTAAFMSQLDLVIAVDTAVVHLAGALGISCWTLSQLSPCWRWQGIHQESGWPWYLGMRVLRQTSHEDWGSLLDRCATDLKNVPKLTSKMAA